MNIMSKQLAILVMLCVAIGVATGVGVHHIALGNFESASLYIGYVVGSFPIAIMMAIRAAKDDT